MKAAASQETTRTSSEQLNLGTKFEEIMQYVEQKAVNRELRRKAFEGKQPTPKPCFVAWIDILGFKNALRGATEPETFKKAYDKVRRVHEEFAKESAVPDPEDQAQLNLDYGRRVISLSDGLVVVQALKSPYLDARVMTPYSFIDGFIDDLRMAQAQCAYEGIFLRGGIALGNFWFEDDILLSPALIEAYLIESKVAKNPAILIGAELVEAIKRLHGRMKEDDGIRHYRKCEWLTPALADKYRMLNYIDILVSEDHGWNSSEDRAAYYEEGKSAKERDNLFNESRHKRTGRVLRTFKDQLISAYNEAKDEKVRNKYRWLMRYHNASFPHDHPALTGAAINDSDGVSLDDVEDVA